MKHTMIVMMGGQGAGKGSMAAIMKTEHTYKHIESGALFRALPADSEIAKIIARGELVPDSELFKLMQSQITDDSDIIFDENFYNVFLNVVFIWYKAQIWRIK